jgi:hypothetical protein
MSVTWLATGLSLCGMLVLTILLWVQWLHTQQRKAELSVLRSLMKEVSEVIERLEAEKAELSAGLRAEKGQVEQLRRRLQVPAR